MITVRRADERGLTSTQWLNSRHSFSFGQYHDPDRMGFGSLRVLNDDWVQPGFGFARHGHRDMEIFSYVIAGTLRHSDDVGHEGNLATGRVQLMGAGTGIEHSESNPSREEPVHFLQCWIIPREKGLMPIYQEMDPGPRVDSNFVLVASPSGETGSMEIRQDILIYCAHLTAGQSLALPNSGATGLGWLHIAEGQVELGNYALLAGDGVALEAEYELQIKAQSSAKLLYFAL